MNRFTSNFNNFPTPNQLILILLLSILATSNSISSRPLYQEYNPIGLQNGCLPEAFIFNDNLAKRFPQSEPSVEILEITGCGDPYAHALVLYKNDLSWYFWDYQFGNIKLRLKSSQSREIARLKAKSSYQRSIYRYLRTGEIRFQKSRTNDALAYEKVLQRLAHRDATLITFITGKKGSHHAGVVFGGLGHMWLYMPELGARFIKADGIATFDQLLAAMLKRDYGRFQIESKRTYQSLIAAKE